MRAPWFIFSSSLLAWHTRAAPARRLILRGTLIRRVASSINGAAAVSYEKHGDNNHHRQTNGNTLERNIIVSMSE